MSAKSSRRTTNRKRRTTKCSPGISFLFKSEENLSPRVSVEGNTTQTSAENKTKQELGKKRSKKSINETSQTNRTSDLIGAMYHMKSRSRIQSGEKSKTSKQVQFSTSFSNRKLSNSSESITNEASKLIESDNDSSLEISFKKKPSRILGELNLTNLTSRKASFRQSPVGEDDKMKFITMRKGCKTMIDWDTQSIEKKVGFKINDKNTSPTGNLIRQATFVKENSMIKTPEPPRSARKCWSQSEKTPISGTFTNVNALFSTQRDNNTPKWVLNTPHPIKSVIKGRKSSKIDNLSVKFEVKTPKDSTLNLNQNSFILNSTTYSPISRTSTPNDFITKKQESILKKVLTNENKTKITKRVRMPNFEKIHQRQFEKMENLEELQKRKAMRAQFLLSGTKPPPSTSLIGTTEKESRKKLQFSPIMKEVTNKENSVKSISKPLQNLINKRNSLTKKKEFKSKLPILAQARAAKVLQSIKAPTKEIAAKKMEKRREESRKKLQGVRTNRRFELLMAMRKQKF